MTLEAKPRQPANAQLQGVVRSGGHEALVKPRQLQPLKERL